MLPEWKLNIFINAVKVRTQEESKTAQEIVDGYTKLTIDEKQQILDAIQ